MTNVMQKEKEKLFCHCTISCWSNKQNLPKPKQIYDWFFLVSYIKRFPRFANKLALQ